MFELIAQAKPAGGAALDQVAIASGAAIVVTAVLMWLGLGHRSGKVALLGRIGAYSERVSGLPAWAAIPSGMIVVSLITALFGMLWDISLHIAEGRDEGPLANVAHYFILAGLFGVFASGFLSMCLPLEKPSRVAVKVAPGWYAPLGGVLIAAAGTFALIGFPLDDVWHRLFGQDVTLWGPTHLMLIGGAAMALIGLAVLMTEAGLSSARRARSWVAFVQRVSLPGAFLLGLSTFQAEFDFGVPQFRMVFQPLLIMLAAGVSLVAARIWLGRGAALGAAVFFLAMRGLMAVLVGPVLGEPTPYFPLFLVSAVLVELAALRVKEPLRLAVVSGGLLGTVGLASEWAWTHVFMPLPWPAALLPEGAVAGFVMALAASCVGGWLGARLATDRTPSLRSAAVGGAALIFALTAYGLWSNGESGARGTVTVAGDGFTVRTDLPQDPIWLTSTSWQGGGLVVDRLERVGPDEYRTTEPIPMDGEWKTMIRLHYGRTLSALPIYLPADPAIPVEGIPARAETTRDFGPEQQLLQRERKTDVAGWLWAVAYGVVLAIALAFLAALAWGVHRVSATGRPAEREHVDQQRQGHRSHQHREPATQQ
ncbi:hypothetical protein OJ997_12510 [Solirubrobacter phytolaccae]|uniref:Uncharacterized protein n=1 Tax=Solirubrobacter phytolaccae TaxID=1404360 RepID=A0A9X3N773_9ACTN|nr:hypothetical protein [Solirubrobacter phytolaccae]MDA0181120.1 hypothetical protein [Solirubrobacter phytolaccae]